jgi:pimeloyl-ACP methyl ester carboxylesterase
VRQHLAGVLAEPAALPGREQLSLAALEAAARAPERVSHLVLIGTAYPMKVSPSLLAASLEQTQEAIDRVARYSHSREAVQAAQQARPQAPSPVDLTRTLMQQVQASNPQTPLMHIGFQACNQYLGGEVAMEKVLCPTLFLLGRQDVMTPPEAVATLQTRAGRGQTALIDSGHALMSDKPDGMMAALRDFLPVAPAR